jgi:hypothetical protein
MILVTLLFLAPAAAQNMRVDVAKRGNRIPQACQSVVPASLEGQIDMPSLVKELVCKGAGDMLIEYTYVMQVNSSEKDKKGNIKEEKTTYEVFIPTLKSGMHTRGILLVTSRNGVAVPPEELEKERLKTGERLEKEENKIARADEPKPEANSESVKGMLPLGMYTHSSINRSAFGIRRGGATVSIDDFLANCDLTLLRREQKDGREVLIFRFMPKAQAQVSANAMYIAQLTGEIWVDATDHIVTRLAGWPRDLNATDSQRSSTEKPPAVYAEMMRLREGIWLPRLIQLNGSTYPTLFDHITTDISWIYSNYIHFSTEIKDFKMNSPNNP